MSRVLRTAKLRRAHAKHVAAGKKAAATRARDFSKLTPKQRAVEEAKLRRAGRAGGRANAARIKAFEKAHHGHPPPRKPRKLASGGSSSMSSVWLLGENDISDCCVAVAIANSFRYSQPNVAIDERELATMCRMLPDTSIAYGLEFARVWQFMGYSLQYYPVSTVQPGAIVGIRLDISQHMQTTWDYVPSPEWGSHAVVVASLGSMVTWGTEISTTEAFLSHQVEETWLVEWEKV